MRKPFKRNWKKSDQELLFNGQAIRRLGMLSEDLTSPNLDVLNHGVLKAGLRLPWFFHEDRDEMIIVLKGKGTVHFQEFDSIDLEEGDVLCVPAKVHHAVENIAEEDFEAFFFKVYC